jgi:hypothetical protein
MLVITRGYGQWSRQTLPHLRPVSRYLERCIEAFRSTLRQFAMKDLRDYAERGCEVVERVSFV